MHVEEECGEIRASPCCPRILQLLTLQLGNIPYPSSPGCFDIVFPVER